MLDRIAQLIAGHPWRVAVAGLLFAAAAGTIGGPVAGLLQGGGFQDPAAQSTQAATSLEAATGIRPDGGVIVLVDGGAPATGPASLALIGRVAGAVAADPGVKATLTYPATHSPALISRDGTRTLVVGLLRTQSDAEAGKAAKRIQAALASEPRAVVGGAAIAQAQVEAQVTADLGRAEMLAFPILFLLSLWVFRGAVAALLPLLVGGITIVGAFLGLRLVTLHTPLSIFALNLVTGMGLGLAIDYSLFMVSRFREELAAGHATAEAVRRTLNTAGRTILFSSLTVASAIASLTVFPERFLYSMGIGGVLVALIACSVSLILLPAVLMLLGPRVNALAPRRWQRPLEAGGGFWYRLSHFVIRRPLPVALAGAGVLILLGLPFSGIKFTSVDASVLPTSASARQVSDVLARDFPHSATSSVFVYASGSAGEVAGLGGQIRSLPSVAGADVARLGTAGWRIDVHTSAGGLAPSTLDVVKSIRAISSPARFQVGGESAVFIDLQSSLGAHLPVAIAIVVGATLLLLFLMTGSVVLPVKAILMNALTLSAAFGILVVIFQEGHLQGLLNFTSQGALESTQPVLLFALVFGLSTDYGVFLLSRIKEAHDAGTPNSEAVATGLGKTGRLVTAAALLFCVAVGAFATSQIVFIKELGVGTAAGVVLDATIVRAFLVPSLMGLLGKWNWWAPSPLRLVHRRFGLSERRLAPASS